MRIGGGEARRLIDGLFAASGALAAIFLLLIGLLVVAQIVGRLFGVLVPSADEFAGYCLAASSFLALGQALRTNSHIRVTLLLQRLQPRRRRAAEIWCLAVGSALSAYLAWFVIEMVWQSFAFGDLTQGLVPIPLWLPQLGMAIGVCMLTLAFLLDLIRVLAGEAASYAGKGESVERIDTARREAAGFGQ